MEMKNRVHPRLKRYDYGAVGCYHIIIQTKPGTPALSQMTAVPEEAPSYSIPRGRLIYDGRIRTSLTPLGKLILQVMKSKLAEYPQLQVDNFVFMPTHIHLLIRVKADGNQSVIDFIKAIKGNSTFLWNQAAKAKGNKIFQTSFYDHVIRGEEDYLDTMRYINENPLKEMLRQEG